jgi:hypothetical protein
MNLLDIILFLIIIITSIRGAYKGFIHTLFAFISVLFSLIFTRIFYIPFSNFIFNNFEFATKLQILFSKLINEVGFTDNPLKSSMTFADLPGPLRVLFSGTNVFDIGTTMSNLVTKMFLSVIVGIILYILFFFAFKLLGYFFEGIFSIPLLREVNLLAGFFIGLLKSFIYVGVILLFISFGASLAPSSQLGIWIDNSFIVSILKHLIIYKTIIDFR